MSSLKLDENSDELSKRVEDAVGKREIAHYMQFLLFPRHFQKTKSCSTDKHKHQFVWVKVLFTKTAKF